jgi:hypothetical protein
VVVCWDDALAWPSLLVGGTRSSLRCLLVSRSIGMQSYIALFIGLELAILTWSSDPTGHGSFLTRVREYHGLPLSTCPHILPLYRIEYHYRRAFLHNACHALVEQRHDTIW